MEGDDRVRTCDQCQLRVFNLSGMREHEAEELIATAEGRLCVRLYQRADGTVITADCPIGLMAFWRGVRRALAYGGGVMALLFAYLSGAISSLSEEPKPTNSAVRLPWTVIPDFVRNKFSNPIMGAIVPDSQHDAPDRQ
jgi:hypothetical protein